MRTSKLYRILHDGSEIAIGTDVKSRWSTVIEFGDRRLSGNLELQERTTMAGTPDELSDFQQSLANEMVARTAAIARAEGR